MLEPEEFSGYWADVSAVVRAMEQVYKACHLNFSMLGSAMPHVHTHVVPRYVDDERPGLPIDPVGPTIGEDELARQVEQLRAAIAV